MKLPAAFDRFIKKTSPPVERFFSLVIDERYVQSALWSISERGMSVVANCKTERINEDSWEARTAGLDKALSRLDDDEAPGDVHKVVLGLSPRYLTPSGEIQSAVRSEVKKLCKELDLIPIGFVSIPAAVVHKLKIEEGVPPTMILLCLSDGKCTVSLHKVGVRVAEETIGVDNIVVQLEETLKKLKDVEVLPSRILLCGTDTEKLETVKHDLLKHPWPTRVSFLHFPKIDLLPLYFAVEAVSLAGSQEMGVTMDVLDEGKDVQHEAFREENIEKKVDETPTLIDEQNAVPTDEDENVVEVAPEELGFQREDVLEKIQSKRIAAKHEEEQRQTNTMILTKVTIPTISLDRVTRLLAHISFPSFGIPIAGVVIAVSILFGLYLWFLPKAVITVMVVPKTLEVNTALEVHPAAAVADASTKTIPGKTQEKVVSGEKTIPVTGKKEVGDPAKGTVTVYNKATSERALKKGMQLVSGNVAFSLDDDIKIASASESIGSITFGKGNASVTAVAIGTKGNLPNGTEFTFKDIATSIAIARNDQLFTGGTSREVIVVSRADYDALVKGLTGDLVEKAKAELATSVSGREKLIDATITSTVTDKSFQEELDQETNKLHGKITVTVTGISYSEEDLHKVFQDLVKTQIPSGYIMSAEQTSTTITDVKVKKDKTIILSATIKGIAIPTVNTRDIAAALVGKSMVQAAEYLKRVNGVGGVEVSSRWSLLKNRLPMNERNISVSIALQE